LSPFAAATWLPKVLRWYQAADLLEWMWWQAVSLPGSNSKDPVVLHDECVHTVLLYSSDVAPVALRRLESLARETGVPIWDPEKYAELLSSDHWSTSRPKAPIGSSEVDRYGYAITWVLEAAGTAAGHQVLLAALQRALGEKQTSEKAVSEAVGKAVAVALALPPRRCCIIDPANCIIDPANCIVVQQFAALMALARWLGDSSK
jgi:hypothetical protein